MASLAARLTGENHSCQAFKKCSGYAHCLEVAQKGKSQPFWATSKSQVKIS